MVGLQNRITENNSNNNTNPDFNYCGKLNNICSSSNDTKVLQKALVMELTQIYLNVILNLVSSNLIFTCLIR